MYRWKSLLYHIFYHNIPEIINISADGCDNGTTHARTTHTRTDGQTYTQTQRETRKQRDKERESEAGRQTDTRSIDAYAHSRRISAQAHKRAGTHAHLH